MKRPTPVMDKECWKIRADYKLFCRLLLHLQKQESETESLSFMHLHLCFLVSMSMGVQTLGNEDKGVVWLRIQVVDTSPAAAHKLQYNPEEQSTSTLHSSPICCIKKQKKSNNSTISSRWKLSHSHCLSSYFPRHWLFDHCTKETPCVLTLNLTEEAQLTMKLLHASAPKTKWMHPSVI